MADPATLTAPHRAANFDRVAHVYRWAEYLFLGPLLSRTRRHYLLKLQTAKKALVLGDGDGRFLAALLQTSPHLQALAVDSSKEMLQLLSHRCAFAEARLLTFHTPAVPLPESLPLGEVDLIVTHFFLDCLSSAQLASLAHQLAGRVKPGCRWLLSDFGLPARQPWRVLARLYVRTLYLAFALLTRLPVRRLPPMAHALRHAGFVPTHRTSWHKGLLFTEIWQLPAPSAVSDRHACATSLPRESSTLG